MTSWILARGALTYLVSLALMAAPHQASANPGGVDTSFGDAGVVTTDNEGRVDSVRTVLVQDDDKIVAIGDSEDSQTGVPSLLVVRYLADGDVDTSYAVNGRFRLAQFGYVRGAVPRANGGLVVMNDSFRFTALDADGAIDVTFGVNGTQIVPFPTLVSPGSNAIALAVGKIVAAGFSVTGYATPWQPWARLDASNGSLDSSFGDGGTLERYGATSAHGLAAYPNETVVAVGGTHGWTGTSFLVERLRHDGSGLDPCFGGVLCSGHGYVTASIGGGWESANAVALWSDGRIVVGGTTDPGGDAAIFRFNVNGSDDLSFAGTGRITTAALDGAHALLIAGDKILAAGGPSLATIRIEDDGALDASFGSGGVASPPIGGRGRSIAVQSSGKILVAGRTPAVGSDADFVIVRYHGDPPVCGNGSLEVNESCDDGNTSSGDGCSATCQNEPGSSQDNPIFPIPSADECNRCPIEIRERCRIGISAALTPLWWFCAVPTAVWSDPPLASGFEYQMQSGALFTDILELPAGFGSDMAVIVDGRTIASGLGAGDSLNLGSGVGQFRVVGFQPRPDAQAPDAFPIRLAFDAAEASFTIRPQTCSLTPASDCHDTWGTGSFFSNERVPGRESIQVRLGSGPGLTPLDIGNPLVGEGTGYSLCVYDDADLLVGSFNWMGAGEQCGARTCWKSIGPPSAGRGYTYASGAKNSDGIYKGKLTAGVAGRSAISLSARNNAARGQRSMPTGISRGLAGSESVRVQLQRHDAAACFSATLTQIDTSTETRFKARK